MAAYRLDSRSFSFFSLGCLVLQVSYSLFCKPQSWLLAAGKSEAIVRLGLQGFLAVLG